MKAIMLVSLVLVIIPIMATSESDTLSVETIKTIETDETGETIETVETETEVPTASSSEELNDVDKPMEEIKEIQTEDSKNETEKGLRTSPKKMTCLPMKGLNFTSVSKN